jgi:hypothetical protein
MRFSQIPRALRNWGEFPILAFIPGGGLKRPLLPEKVGSGKSGKPCVVHATVARDGEAPVPRPYPRSPRG